MQTKIVSLFNCESNAILTDVFIDDKSRNELEIVFNPQKRLKLFSVMNCTKLRNTTDRPKTRVMSAVHTIGKSMVKHCSISERTGRRETHTEFEFE